MEVLEIVRSGFQFGVDIAAISAAYELGIKTTGYIPKGFRTLYGDKPELKKYGAVETDDCYYPKRTFLNVKESDATIRIAYNFQSPGERLTLKAIKQYKKPYLDLYFDELPFVFDVSDWIKANNIKHLNVAGNCGQNRVKSKEIYRKIKPYLMNVFKAC